MLKKLFYIFVIFFITISFTPALFIFYFNTNTPATILEKHPYTAGVVFGASVRPHSKLSPILKMRMDASIFLYKKNIIQKIICSGSPKDTYSQSEPLAMKLYALKKGIPKKDIFLDIAGQNTYKTVINAVRFQSNHKNLKIIFISSDFHIPRINLIAKMLNMSNFSSFFPKKRSLFHPFIFRESLALTAYALYYPVFKIKKYLQKRKI